MKVASFEVTTSIGRARRLGLVLADERRLLDLNAATCAFLAAETDEPTPRGLAALRTPNDMIGWLQAGAKGRECAERAAAFVAADETRLGLDGERLIYSMSEVRLLAPLPRPRSFRAFSIYEDHMTRTESPALVGGGGRYRRSPDWYRAPPYYKGACDSFAGPQDPAPFPYYTEKLDFELEIAIIIGREGCNLTVAEAASHIAGYAMLVDSSCRDGYAREPFGPTKRKDFHTALGPWMATPDEVDIECLACSILGDGAVWFEGSTGAPHSFTPAQLVAYASDNETIHPGDLLSTGTIGFACSMDHHHWPRIGQSITFRIETLGEMTLRVIPGERRVSHVLGMNGLLTAPDEPPPPS